ncbi:hypothetical protein [Bacillus sp. EB600]|uniref:hypothetical protein n=1 Tax=Bacillus sp. EB600 TaxID=2806345 RepID=UPI00210C0665|nr:hypothetical protein [Bacillus sp. EB600]MCQ6282271.1 hypothetical protein [Bacillus sp. EB600]
MVKEKVQPHCEVCGKPFKRNDMVNTDTLFTQIKHSKCFNFKPEFIKDTGTYEEIVNKYPKYKKVFIVKDKPITNILIKAQYKNKK